MRVISSICSDELIRTRVVKKSAWFTDYRPLFKKEATFGALWKQEVIKNNNALWIELALKSFYDVIKVVSLLPKINLLISKVWIKGYKYTF